MAGFNGILSQEAVWAIRGWLGATFTEQPHSVSTTAQYPEMESDTLQAPISLMGPDNRGRPMRNLCLALLLILLAAGAATARENKPPGSNLIALTSAQLSQLVPPGVELGPQDSSIPAFPLLRGGKIVGYVFSTGTVAPMPGFTGTPIDLAVAINREGEFLDIEILNQKEPVFV
ncbi:MAG: hypothetical protein WBV79_10490, partial [Rhodomicrobium sp.]